MKRCQLPHYTQVFQKAIFFFAQAAGSAQHFVAAALFAAFAQHALAEPWERLAAAFPCWLHVLLACALAANVLYHNYDDL